jgi:hypothetical protein
MRFVVILLAVIIIISCLALGYFVGNLTLQDNSSPIYSPSQTKQVSTMLPDNPGQFNLLFVMADNLENPQPLLESVWAAGFLPESSEIYLVLLYPSTDNEGIPGKLSSAFSISSGKLNDHFLDILDAYHIRLDGYFVSDQNGAILWINWLGGVDLADGRGTQDGLTIINELPDPWKDPALSRQTQLKIIAGICGRLSRLTTDSNIFQVVSTLVPAHFYSNLSLENAASYWQKMISGSKRLNCQVNPP